MVLKRSNAKNQCLMSFKTVQDQLAAATARVKELEAQEVERVALLQDKDKLIAELKETSNRQSTRIKEVEGELKCSEEARLQEQERHAKLLADTELRESTTASKYISLKKVYKDLKRDLINAMKGLRGNQTVIAGLKNEVSTLTKKYEELEKPARLVANAVVPEDQVPGSLLERLNQAPAKLVAFAKETGAAAANAVLALVHIYYPETNLEPIGEGLPEGRTEDEFVAAQEVVAPIAEKVGEFIEL